MMTPDSGRRLFASAALIWMLAGIAHAQESGPGKKETGPPAAPVPTAGTTTALFVYAYPPALPGGAAYASDQSPQFLKPPANLRTGVVIAKAAPKIDFLYLPGQDYRGNPWSCWGGGCVVGDKHYTAIGDHLSPRGAGLLYEYDSQSRRARVLVNLRDFLESNGIVKRGSYTPGKIHTSISMGSDGWLYYAGHRGGADGTTDEHNYAGDWIFRTDPASATTQIVAPCPIPKHSIITGMLDPQRMVFYGTTAVGKDAPERQSQLLVYDVRNKKLLMKHPHEADIGYFYSTSKGILYWEGHKYDLASNQISASNAPRSAAASVETPQGRIYGLYDRAGGEGWCFDVASGAVEKLGQMCVGEQTWIARVIPDPTGKYLYYVSGCHGHTRVDGTPIVQFNTRTRQRKIIAFLYPYFADRYGYVPDGTYGVAIGENGEKLYITWNGMRTGPEPLAWESCALTVVHIPDSERE